MELHCLCNAYLIKAKVLSQPVPYYILQWYVQGTLSISLPTSQIESSIATCSFTLHSTPCFKLAGHGLMVFVREF